MLLSCRTTKVMWLSPPVSVRRNRAMWTPETVVDGTVQEAETAQLPQSNRAVAASVMHSGWVCGNFADGLTSAILRAPAPPYQPRR